MFIELTDHLRCPADHPESFLVLLPDGVEGRSVRTGHLGCPVCGRTFILREGILDFGGQPLPPSPDTALGGEAITALAGLSGPGGYLALVGAPARAWREVEELNPGVALVAVNPDAGVGDEPGVSVLRGDRLPLKSHSMRGVVLGRPFADDVRWVGDAARAVLPGLHVVGEGQSPAEDRLELLATASGVWVGKVRGGASTRTAPQSPPGAAPPQSGGEP
jgi:uncharacterized protein YbaR (Trm112 family)